MQPDGKFALWSSISEDFVLWDATPAEICEELTVEAKESVLIEVAKIVSKLREGEKPYYQFTQSFSECLERIREVHEDSESLQYFDSPIRVDDYPHWSTMSDQAKDEAIRKAY